MKTEASGSRLVREEAFANSLNTMKVDVFRKNIAQQLSQQESTVYHVTTSVYGFMVQDSARPHIVFWFGTENGRPVDIVDDIN